MSPLVTVCRTTHLDQLNYPGQLAHPFQLSGRWKRLEYCSALGLFGWARRCDLLCAWTRLGALGMSMKMVMTMIMMAAVVMLVMAMVAILNNSGEY